MAGAQRTSPPVAENRASRHAGHMLESAPEALDYDFLFPEKRDAPDQAYLIAALATLLREDAEARRVDRAGSDPYSPWRMTDGWRLNSQSERRLVFRFGAIQRGKEETGIEEKRHR